ncbi:hypothetical protein ACQP2F_00460 [Actinoplanes sp. CA-030573]|uniref:hypothetical protein n=1 Tax=Actinoplanes sp. CA-030573 TaxID=3239898 RepID=UPI003D91AB33
MTTLALLVVLGILGYTAFYILNCAYNPWGVCKRYRCRSGRIYSRIFSKTFRECPRCNGTGRRVRIGRRIYEYLRAEHKAGNR